MMLLFEVKKVLSKPLNKAALLILAAVLISRKSRRIFSQRKPSGFIYH